MAVQILPAESYQRHGTPLQPLPPFTKGMLWRMRSVQGKSHRAEFLVRLEVQGEHAPTPGFAHQQC